MGNFEHAVCENRTIPPIRLTGEYATGFAVIARWYSTQMLCTKKTQDGRIMMVSIHIIQYMLADSRGDDRHKVYIKVQMKLLSIDVKNKLA